RNPKTTPSIRARYRSRSRSRPFRPNVENENDNENEHEPSASSCGSLDDTPRFVRVIVLVRVLGRFVRTSRTRTSTNPPPPVDTEASLTYHPPLHREGDPCGSRKSSRPRR